MTVRALAVPDPEVPGISRRPTYTAAFKRKVLKELEKQPEGERGAYLRARGLYSGTVSRWKRELDAATLGAMQPRKRGPTPKKSAEEVEVARLRRRVAELEHRLEVAEEIIEVQKKISELFGKKRPTPTPDEPSESG